MLVSMWTEYIRKRIISEEVTPGRWYMNDACPVERAEETRGINSLVILIRTIPNHPHPLQITLSNYVYGPL